MSGQSDDSLRGKRIALVTHGSRGDVQPNVALALALKAAGAVVTFVALADHADFLARYGIDDFIPFKTTARELFELLKESLGGDDPESLARGIVNVLHSSASAQLSTTSPPQAHSPLDRHCTSCTPRHAPTLLLNHSSMPYTLRTNISLPRTRSSAPPSYTAHRYTPAIALPFLWRADEGQFLKKYMEQYEPRFKQDVPALVEALVAREQDLVLYHSAVELSVLSIAEKTGVKAATLIFIPWRVTTAFPPPTLNPETIPEGTTNVDLWQGCLASAVSEMGVKCENWFRKELLHLPEAQLDVEYIQRRHKETPIIHAFSELLVPTPDDWDTALAKTVGYLVLKDENAAAWQPSAELATFLEAGERPLYFGFGSMIHKDPAYIFDVVLRTVAATGRRALICEGWYLLRKPADFQPADYGLREGQVMFIHDVPHTWLLPRCACSVIHGGAGTTAAAIRAGRPCVFLPFLIDQPWWAYRAIQAGVSPRPVLSSITVTAESLTASVQKALADDAMAERAQELGQKLCQEDGVAKAVDEIRALLQ